VSIGAIEAGVAIGDEFALRDQAVEGLVHQLLAFLDVIEDAVAEDEEAGVDPGVGVFARPQALHTAVLVELDEVEGERRAHG
jgi:hypothetical protein